MLTHDGIKSLLKDQRSALERYQIHKSNYNELLKQKAMHGISPPLEIINGIKFEEQEIRRLEVEIDELDSKIASITKLMPPELQPGSKTERGISLDYTLNIEGRDYTIQAPYPLLGFIAKVPLKGKLDVVTSYGGGYEVHSRTQEQGGLLIQFFRHGRRISPSVDMAKDKLVLPLGIHVCLPNAVMDFGPETSTQETTSTPDSSHRWTIISPGAAIDNATTVEFYEQQEDHYVLTSQFRFTENKEIWIVQKPQAPARVWFYDSHREVVPNVDENRLTVSFPDEKN